VLNPLASASSRVCVMCLDPIVDGREAAGCPRCAGWMPMHIQCAARVQAATPDGRPAGCLMCHDESTPPPPPGSVVVRLSEAPDPNADPVADPEVPRSPRSSQGSDLSLKMRCAGHRLGIFCGFVVLLVTALSVYNDTAAYDALQLLANPLITYAIVLMFAETIRCWQRCRCGF